MIKVNSLSILKMNVHLSDRRKMLMDKEREYMSNRSWSAYISARLIPHHLIMIVLRQKVSWSLYLYLCIYAVPWPLEKELRKRLVKCFVWSVALYGSETWALRWSEQKRLEAFQKRIWRRMEHVKWTDKIKNAVVLERVGEGRIMLELIKKKKRNLLGRWLRRNCLLKDALEQRSPA